MYDAGVLLLHAAERDWAKLCFEYSPQLKPTAVTVVTRGTSDDCNSFEVDGSTLWLRITRSGAAWAFHASTDGAWWRLLRYFTLGLELVRVGFLAQSPTGRGARPRSTMSRSGPGRRRTCATGVSLARLASVRAVRGAAGPAGPQGVRADAGLRAAGRRLAGRGELARARPGRVPPQAGRGRGGPAGRPADDRGRAAPRAAAPVAGRPARRDGGTRRVRGPGCCWKAWCCGCGRTCAGSRHVNGTGRAGRD